MSIEPQIKGLDTVFDSLDTFAKNIQKNILSGAIRAGAKPIVKSVREYAPVDTGNLKKSIGVLKRKSKNKTEVHFSVGARRGGKYDGYYAHMVEFGTSKQAAHPFFRPAFEAQSNESIEAVKDYLLKRVDKEILKARR